MSWAEGVRNIERLTVQCCGNKVGLAGQELHQLLLFVFFTLVFLFLVQTWVVVEQVGECRHAGTGKSM